MADIRMVTLRSTVNYPVNVFSTAYNINRDFTTLGARQVLPFDVVQQLLWDNGFKYMIEHGILYIDDMQTKIDLGLEEPDTTVPTRIRVLEPAQIEKLLKQSSYDEFVKEMNGLSVEQLDNIVDYAVKNNIVDINKSDFLKKYTGRDIVVIIGKKRANAEAEVREAKRAADEAKNGREGDFRRI